MYMYIRNIYFRLHFRNSILLLVSGLEGWLLRYYAIREDDGN